MVPAFIDLILKRILSIRRTPEREWWWVGSELRESATDDGGGAKWEEFKRSNTRTGESVPKKTALARKPEAASCARTPEIFIYAYFYMYVRAYIHIVNETLVAYCK